MSEVRDTVDPELGAKAVQDWLLAAVKQVGGELIRDLKARVRTQNPLPWESSSKDGEYPKMRTGSFHDGLTLTYDPATKSIKLYSYAANPFGVEDHHGVYLQNKLRDGTTRPYASLILAEQDWIGRIADTVRAMA